jgi:hypothetical protein
MLTIAAVCAIAVLVLFIGFFGFWLSIIIICALLASMVRIVPMWVIRFIAKAVAIETLLPKFGLIVFHGGFIDAGFTVFIIACAAILTQMVLHQTSVVRDVEGEITSQRSTSPSQAFVLHMVVLSVVFSVSLYLTAFIDSDVVLLGLQQTVGAAAILALIDTVCRR